MFPIIEKWMARMAYGLNITAGACIVGMMLLTCADVFLRFFRHPITGTYEIVGFLGALFVAFSLAYTAYQRGHIAVDFLVQKLSDRTRLVIMCINDLLGSGLFALIAFQSVVYGHRLKMTGEVSMTLKLPVSPVVYGLAIGCGMLSMLLLFTATSNALNFFLSKKKPENER